MLAKKGFDLLGLDGSFILCDGERLPFRSGVFDHAYCYGVLHHLENAELAIYELKRVLKATGSLTAMVYARRSIPFLYIIIKYGLLKGELLRH
jgi:ubiquinone/menaquinone biosynthesis C-methylase UbiE